MRGSFSSVGVLAARVAASAGCRQGSGVGVGVLELTDVNNYAYDAELALGVVEIATEADATVAWSDLTTDLRGRPVEPSAIDELWFAEFLLSQEEVIELALSSGLDHGDALSAWSWENAGASATTLDGNLTVVGVRFDAETFLREDEGRTWVMALLEANDLAYEVLAAQFVVPTAASTNHEITFGDETSSLTVEVDLSAPPIETREGHARYGLDWSGLARDVHGVPWDPMVGDRLVLAHHAGDLDAVAADFVRLDTAATAFYQLDVFDRTRVPDLSEAVDAEGNPFPGFTAEGTWLVGLSCATCASAMPLAAAVVEVSP